MVRALVDLNSRPLDFQFLESLINAMIFFDVSDCMTFPRLNIVFRRHGHFFYNPFCFLYSPGVRLVTFLKIFEK